MNAGDRLRVAVTRDDRADGAMTHALRYLGFEPVPCAAFRERPAADTLPLERSAARLEHYAWIVAASARAVGAVRSARGSRAWPATLRGGAVGERTARALLDCGLSHVTLGREPGAEALLAALLGADAWPGRRVLVPRAAEGLRVLEEGLRAAGAEVDVVVAYRTSPVPAAQIRRRWKSESPEAALIASPSAARALVDALGPGALRELRAVVALGPTTAAALRALDVPACVASHATFEAAAETLRHHLRNGGISS